MIDETLTADSVRENYISSWGACTIDDYNVAAAEFNAWLNQERAKVWTEAVYHLEPFIGGETRRAAMGDNPYA